MQIPSISHFTTLTLKHSGDCSLLGVSRDGMVFAEEVYGDNAWVAQHAVKLDGSIVASVDEADGERDIKPLDLPPDVSTPKPGWHTMMLNFAGPRHRGMREPERTADLVRPFDIGEKMQIVQKLKLDMPAPYLLGLAESYVLAETEVVPPNLYFVCRRVRLAIALPEAKRDTDGQPYDYDTLVIYLAHFYDSTQEPPFGTLFENLTFVPLRRPMDCLLVGDQLYIADGGADERLSAIHIWQLDLPAPLTEEEKQLKKIYG